MRMLLRRGSRGPEVEKLQSDLNRIGSSRFPPLVVDGAYGPLTEGRVREFQGQAQIKVDGIAGPQTQAAIAGKLAALGVTSPRDISPSTPTPTSTPQRPVSQLTPKERAKLIREYSKDYDALRRGWGRYVDWLALGGSRFNDLVSLGRAVGVMDSMAGLSGGMGIAGIFLWYYSAINAWAKALNAGRQTYGYRGAAYGATAWFLDRPRVDRSRTILARIQQFRPDKDIHLYHEEWRKAWDRNVQVLRDHDFGGESHQMVKETFKAAFNDDHRALCREMLEGFERAQLVSAQQLAVWRSNYHVVYPD